MKVHLVDGTYELFRAFYGTPPKRAGDGAEVVSGDRIVCRDRMRGTTLTDVGVVEKFGVPPESIPDWLALVGDSADGFPAEFRLAVDAFLSGVA